MRGDPVKFNFTNICEPKSKSSLIVEKTEGKIFMKLHIKELLIEGEYLLLELQDSDKEKSGQCPSFVRGRNLYLMSTHLHVFST